MKFRRELKNIKRIVVKIGSGVITKKNGNIDNRKIRQIVEDICELIDAGVEVILVSSGAVSLGKNFLNEHVSKKDLVNIQHSASSIGQPKLLNTYSRVFEENQRVCSQILLTHNDFRDRKRFLHTKNNINLLLKNKITPVLNENDSISFTEITVGDNDHLAAQTAQMVNADLLLVITSKNGLYNKDPSEPDAIHIKSVPFDFDITSVSLNGKTSVGRGGMESKLHAISKVTPLGISAIISSKHEDRIILEAITREIGTYFYPKNEYDPEERNAWLLSLRKPNCYVEIGREKVDTFLKGKSLEPTIIIKVKGEFFKGDCIEIRCNGEPIASGVCEYDHCEVKKIMGNKSVEIENILGFRTSEQVVESQNLILDKDLNHEDIS